MRAIVWCTLIGAVLLIGACSNNDNGVEEPVLTGDICVLYPKDYSGPPMRFIIYIF